MKQTERDELRNELLTVLRNEMRNEFQRRDEQARSDANSRADRPPIDWTAAERYARENGQYPYCHQPDVAPDEKLHCAIHSPYGRKRKVEAAW